MLDRILLKSQLYKHFVLLQMIDRNAMIHDTEVEVHHGIIHKTNTIIHKTDRYRSTSRDRFSYNKSTTPPHCTRSR